MVHKLKAEDGADMMVWGSGTLIQTLLREKLVDRMHLWTHPVTIGTGKRLFAEGTSSATWKLVTSRVGDAGVIVATYEPAGELEHRWELALRAEVEAQAAAAHVAATPAEPELDPTLRAQLRDAGRRLPEL